MDSNYLVRHIDAINLTIDTLNMGQFVLTYVH
ncbi:Uncharacterised protein [Vibrio furnissii]|nr:Uncharacterised protein [Vibrio furnissii]